MSDFAVDGTQVGIGIALLAALIIGGILFLRKQFADKSPEDLSGKYTGATGISPLAIFNKYPEVDPFKLNTPILLFGIAASFTIIILAFNWTTYDDEIYIPDDALVFEDEIEMEPPRTAEPPPIMSTEALPEEIIQAPEPEPAAPPPPPPPPPPPKRKEIFKVVEDMPRFPGCEDISNKAEREQCAQKKMLEFIYKNIKYPPIARENGIEGMAVIQFVVDENGQIKDPKIIRDVAGGCGTEAMRVVELMSDQVTWVPGKQRGKAVQVYFNLPVRFKLE
jgi:protein TonB